MNCLNERWPGSDRAVLVWRNPAPSTPVLRHRTADFHGLHKEIQVNHESAIIYCYDRNLKLVSIRKEIDRGTIDWPCFCHSYEYPSVQFDFKGTRVIRTERLRVPLILLELSFSNEYRTQVNCFFPLLLMGTHSVVPLVSSSSKYLSLIWPF